MRGARDVPVLVPVHYRGEHGVRVGARADEQEDDEEEGLEVEEGRLRRVSFVRVRVLAAAVDVPWWRWRFSSAIYFVVAY